MKLVLLIVAAFIGVCTVPTGFAHEDAAVSAEAGPVVVGDTTNPPAPGIRWPPGPPPQPADTPPPTEEERMIARNQEGLRRALQCGVDESMAQCYSLADRRVDSEVQARLRKAWRCGAEESFGVCADRKEQASRPRAIYECDEYEPFEDCKNRYRAKQQARFMAEQCHAGETFEVCQERVMVQNKARAMERAAPQIRQQLGCYGSETLERCTERVREEAQYQYLIWLAEQGLNPDEVFAMPSEEENRLRAQMGNFPLLYPPDVKAIAMRWYVCKRIEDGEAPPTPPAVARYVESAGETRVIDPCESAFDPFHWKTLPPMNR